MQLLEWLKENNTYLTSSTKFGFGLMIFFFLYLTLNGGVNRMDEEICYDFLFYIL